MLLYVGLGSIFYIIQFIKSFTLVIIAITFNYVYWQCKNKCVIKIVGTSLSAELKTIAIKITGKAKGENFFVSNFPAVRFCKWWGEESNYISLPWPNRMEMCKNVRRSRKQKTKKCN